MTFMLSSLNVTFPASTSFLQKVPFQPEGPRGKAISETDRNAFLDPAKSKMVEDFISGFSPLENSHSPPLGFAEEMDAPGMTFFPENPEMETSFFSKAELPDIGVSPPTANTVPFVSVFPSEFRGPVAVRPGPKGRRKVAIRPKLAFKTNSNSTDSHLPVLWAALSLALGLEVRGELIRGLPCITRFNQLFCRGGGPSYPTERIQRFIDDNKALVRRMHGDFIEIDLAQILRAGRKKRAVESNVNGTNSYFTRFLDFNPEDMEGTFEQLNDTEGIYGPSLGEGDPLKRGPYVNVFRRRRQVSNSPGPLPQSNRFDACESDEEVATPYWASSSRGKILAIVNTEEFSQIIHQEICTKSSTKRCRRDCGCEQKYKYHRLMAYDPDNDCKGIFMEWFLFPSCCSCRCDP